jgi:ribosomal protein L21
MVCGMYFGGTHMYAVVATGGKQYKVQEGEILRVEKLTGEVGSEIAFDQVLMTSDGENVKIGQPMVEGAQVKGHIVEQGKSKKSSSSSINVANATVANRDIASHSRRSRSTPSKPKRPVQESIPWHTKKRAEAQKMAVTAMASAGV